MVGVRATMRKDLKSSFSSVIFSASPSWEWRARIQLESLFMMFLLGERRIISSLK